jgi:hypothetical protein
LDVALDFDLGARAGKNDAPAPPCVFKKFRCEKLLQYHGFDRLEITLIS